jgi:hypothetical protein
MRNKSPEDLFEEEIRFLLVDRCKASRNIRLERFRFVGELDVVGAAGNGSSSGRIKIRGIKAWHRTWLNVLLVLATWHIRKLFLNKKTIWQKLSYLYDPVPAGFEPAISLHYSV